MDTSEQDFGSVPSIEYAPIGQSRQEVRIDGTEETIRAVTEVRRCGSRGKSSDDFQGYTMGNVASRKNYGTPDFRIWGSRVHLNTRIVGKNGSDNRGRHGIRKLPFPKDNIDQGGKG